MIDDPVTSSDLFSLDNDDGLVPFSDEEEGEEEGKLLETIGYQTAVWEPTKGNVGLLTFDVVKALSDHTGSTFYIDSHRNEARLSDGNLTDALFRLNAVEPVLVSASLAYIEHCLDLS